METTVVTGRYLDQQGNPCSGTVTFAPPCLVRDNTGHTIMSGPVTQALDSQGRLRITLPCTEQDGIDPSGWCYTVTERLDCSDCLTTRQVHIPCGQEEIDMSQLPSAAAADDCCGTVIIRGPKGDKGDPGENGATNVRVTDPITVSGTGTDADPFIVGLGLSGDEGNELVLGADGGLYSPAPDGSETVVTAGTNIQVTGTGTAADPYVIATTDIVTSVAAADDTITVTPATGDVTVAVNLSTDTGNHLAAGGDGGLYARGTTLAAADQSLIVNGDPDAGYTAWANISSDASNQLQTGADGGLYVPYTAPIGPEDYVLGDTMQRTSGSGTAEDPYVLDVRVSADAGNTLTTGTDGGLYVPDTGGVSSVAAADGTVTVTPTTGDVTVAAALSTDAGNTLTAGTDGGLLVPATELIGRSGVTVTGSGTSDDQYIASAYLSTDADNDIVLGSDYGLYVPAPRPGYGQFRLAAATVLGDAFATLPITAVQTKRCTLADNTVTLEAGIWYVTVTLNMNGSSGGPAAGYVQILGSGVTIWSNYTSTYVADGKRYGVTAQTGFVSDGTQGFVIQSQRTGVSGTPEVTASTMACVAIRIGDA